MIIVLFGQPHSGKSTLATKLIEEHLPLAVNIDGDKLRDLFNNKDYSRDGRINNLNRASDIAVFLNSIGNDVILSLVYPFEEAREHLNNLCNEVYWVYLTYSEMRGREDKHVKNFDIPETTSVLSLDTSKYTEKECISAILNYVEYTKRRKV